MEAYFECKECGKNVPCFCDAHSSGFWIGEDFYCPDCFHEIFEYCSSCSKPIEKENLTELDDGSLLCDICLPYYDC